MYCLDQFTYQLKDQLTGQKPTFKLICIKLVFAFSLYQDLILSIITAEWIPESLAARTTAIIAYPDLKVCILTLMLCIELMIMSILYIFAFPWQPYRIPEISVDELDSSEVTKPGGFLGILAFADALNIWDLIKALGRAARWLFVGFRNREKDSSYDLISKTTTTYRAQGQDLRLQESNREWRSSFDALHPRAVETLL
ncbi:uncharacterized protein PAC_07961 [Phialocephala subalpina]|uniref:Uncharacterized protein n=1 Tax=Phialocephala subalpina TaxID=576137 RepID=A0A1L7WZ97_9HELO|nr:uncharacterized protein PAC_07961 [Phialocephala subalpina]